MADRTALVPAAEWTQLRTTAGDWDQADAALLRTMLGHVQIIRTFEDRVLDLARAGLVHGPAHSSIGQEGGAAGSILALTATDHVNGSHRGHHQFLSKALAYLRPNGIDPRADLGADVAQLLQRTLAEILGLAQGFCRGRGGSMHLRWAEAGALGTNAIVGGGVPFAAGSAWSHRQSGSDAVTVTYFGDGAVNIGSVLESMNLAAAWRLPLCFFVENNRYAVATNVEEVTGEPRLSGRGAGFGIRSWRVDGMDPLAVYLATSEAVAHMRAGHGPTIVEVEVYRYFHQNGSFPGSAFGYRSKEEERQWRARDPLDQLAGHLLRRGLLTDDELAGFRARVDAAVAQAVERLTESEQTGTPSSRRIRPELWPSPEFRDVGIRGDLAELASARVVEESTFEGKLDERRFVDVVADTMARRMATDERVVVLGEDVHRLNGGTNGATRGLAEAFPDRVLGTPISENAFLGLAGGMAMDGRYRPVAEFMYPDFVWVAADQAFNQIGKARHMFGGDSPVPLVLRTKVAMGTGYGSQHSMDPVGVFVTSPGWRVVAPSTPFDYVGLMNAALACDDPVLVVEHVDLYTSSGMVPVDDLDYHVEIGKAAIRRLGSAATILTYLSMVRASIDAAEQSDVDAEVIDLRWLDPASLDWSTIEASVRKTNRVLIVEQGARGTSYGGWLADEVQRRLFDWLDAPVLRVTGGEASPSISRVLEDAAVAGVADVRAGIESLVGTNGTA